MAKVKVLSNQRLESIIENQTLLERQELSVVDKNNISTLILINFWVRILRLVIIILNISYFLGFAWYIFADLVMNEWSD